MEATGAGLTQVHLLEGDDVGAQLGDLLGRARMTARAVAGSEMSAPASEPVEALPSPAPAPGRPC